MYLEKQRYGELICEVLNNIDTGRDVTVEDIYNYEYLSENQLSSLLLYVRGTSTYAHRCRGIGNGYGVNIAIKWEYHLKKLFGIKGIKLSIYEDRDVSTYITIVWNDSEPLTHSTILRGEGMSDEEIRVSFNEQSQIRKIER